MKVQFICQYCDLRWVEKVFSDHAIKNFRCLRCKDHNLRAKKLEDVTIDTYVGCPPFPEKTEEQPKEKEKIKLDPWYTRW